MMAVGVQTCNYLNISRPKTQADFWGHMAYLYYRYHYTHSPVHISTAQLHIRPDHSSPTIFTTVILHT